MARINIEDSLFKDQRWIDLVIALKSSEAAMGALVWLWLTAQKYWKRDKSRIPKSAWDQQRLNNALIETGWATWEPEYNGFLAEGSEQQFAWLIQKQEAGQKGGLASRPPDFNNLEVSEDKRDRAEISAAKPPTPSPSLTPILSPSSSSSSSSDSSFNIADDVSNETPPAKKKRNPKSKVDDPEKGIRNATWESYRDAYQTRWGVVPDRNASVNSIIKSLVEKIGVDAPDLMTFYLSHNDTHYVKSCHPLTLCLRDHVGLKTQMLRGKPITTADVRRLERQQQQQGLLDELKERNL